MYGFNVTITVDVLKRVQAVYTKLEAYISCLICHFEYSVACLYFKVAHFRFIKENIKSMINKSYMYLYLLLTFLLADQ